MTTDRIRKSIERNPHALDRSIAKNLRVTTHEVAAVRAKMGRGKPVAVVAPNRKVISSVKSKGFDLDASRVLPRKPAESAAMHIKRLPAGRGFEPKVLAHEWGMSEDAIRRHAKELGCLKYVEVSPDEWVPMILSPETAKAYHA